ADLVSDEVQRLEAHGERPQQDVARRHLAGDDADTEDASAVWSTKLERGLDRVLVERTDAERRARQIRTPIGIGLQLIRIWNEFHADQNVERAGPDGLRHGGPPSWGRGRPGGSS